METVEVKSLEFVNFASGQVEAVDNRISAKFAWQKGMEKKLARDKKLRAQKNSWVQEFKKNKNNFGR